MKTTNLRITERVRMFSDIHYSSAKKEINERHAAMEKLAREESIEYKMSLAQRQCVQPLHKLEKEWKNAKTAKVKDESKIEEARQNILMGLDKAATDSVARIMAEIKQKNLASQGLCKKELQQVELSVEEFYNGFDKFLAKFDYFVTEEEFNKIVLIYMEQNLNRIQYLGSLVDYATPAIQLAKNIELLKVYAIKEKELTV